MEINYLARPRTIYLFTCVTIETMEQQNPPMKAVMNMVSTDLAKIVTIQEMEKGRAIIVSTFFRPYFIAKPPNMPPNRAPRGHFFIKIISGQGFKYQEVFGKGLTQ